MPFARNVTKVRLLVSALLIVATSALGLVSVSEATDEGQACFKITTDFATFFLQKQNGGFSSLLDKNGQDWIDFHKNPCTYPAGATGCYRGIPNLVYPDNIMHPGYITATVTKGAVSSTKATFTVKATNNKIEAKYDFYPTHVTLTITKSTTNYWFLYEGTPGGSMNPSQDFYVYPTSATASKRQPCSVKLTSRKLNPGWTYFGDKAVKRVLFFIHVTNDNFSDSYYTMEGTGGMTVYGIGRVGMNKYMTAAPNVFSFGLMEDSANAAVKARIAAITTAGGGPLGDPKGKFTSANAMSLKSGTALSYTFTYTVPDGKTGQIEYATTNPAWVVPVNPNLMGTAPTVTTNTVYTVRAFLKVAGAHHDTMDLKITVEPNIAIRFQGFSTRHSMGLAGHRSNSSNRFLVSLRDPGTFLLRLYNLQGAEIWSYRKTSAYAGDHEIEWPSNHKGIVVANLSQNGNSISRRMLLMK